MKSLREDWSDIDLKKQQEDFTLLCWLISVESAPTWPSTHLSLCGPDPLEFLPISPFPPGSFRELFTVKKIVIGK